VYDQYHKRAITLADTTAEDYAFRKSPEEMFEMKMQLKYGSPLVGGCMKWGHEIDWSTTMRPEGLEQGIMMIRADGNKYRPTPKK